MYLGIDIGGTKTLVAVLDEHGTITEQAKFPTPQKYQDFLTALGNTTAGLKTKSFKAGGVGVPGRLDRQHGRVIKLSNLPWENEAIQADCQAALGCPFVIENDANMAALSESRQHKDYDRVLYFTISTGIGTGVTYKQQLDPGLLDIEGGHMLLPHDGKLVRWEKFASGKAIYEHFGKKAADITDEASWKLIVSNLSLGLYENITVVQPDLVVIGGSVGGYFDRYGKLLNQQLKQYELPVVPIPEVVRAKQPDEAVIYGCYELAKQVYGDGNTDS